MAEQVANGLDRGTVAQQKYSIRMPNAMARSSTGDIQSAPTCPYPECRRYSVCLEGRNRSFHAKENLSKRRWRWSFLQVSMQCCSHCISQRKFENSAGLSLRNGHLTGSPVNVIQGQRHDITGPQPIGCHQEKHRKIAQPYQAGAVDGVEKCLDRLPRQSVGKLLFLVNARGINLAIKPLGYLARYRQEPQEAAKSPHNVLQTCPSQPLTDLFHEGCEIIDSQRSSAGQGALDLEARDDVRCRIWSSAGSVTPRHLEQFSNEHGVRT